MPEYVIIIAVVAVAVIGGVFVTVKLIKRNRAGAAEYEAKRQRRWESERSAYFANAEVVQADAGMTGEQGTRARVRLVLNVLSDPQNPYVAETVWLVGLTSLDTLKPGSVISVKVDRDDPTIVYPGGSWAEFVDI